MCESCNTRHNRPWRRTTSGLVVLALACTLLALAGVGAAAKLGGGARRAVSCARAAPLSIAYQATVTRDRAAGPKRLREDTRAFVDRVQRENLLGCSAIDGLLRQAPRSVAVVCRDCVPALADLERSGGRQATSTVGTAR